VEAPRGALAEPSQALIGSSSFVMEGQTGRETRLAAKLLDDLQQLRSELDGQLVVLAHYLKSGGGPRDWAAERSLRELRAAFSALTERWLREHGDVSAPDAALALQAALNQAEMAMGDRGSAMVASTFLADFRRALDGLPKRTGSLLGPLYSEPGGVSLQPEP
jgi:hypothetical protein